MSFVLARADHLGLLPSGQLCTIPTFDGSGECTHPSVVDSLQVLGHPWQGYRYWMAFTPYPGNDDRRFRLENPSIVASHDGREWIVPDGVANPLVDAPGLLALGRSVELGIPLRRLVWQIIGSALRRSYNADPTVHLSRTGVMYLAYAHSLKGGCHDELRMIESADGWRTVSRRKVLVRTYREPSTYEVNVPSIVAAGDDEIHFYYGYVPLESNGKPRYDRVGIRRRSGKSLFALAPARTLQIAYPPGRRLWHHEIRRDYTGRIVCLATFAPDEGPVDVLAWPPRLSLYYGEIDGDVVHFSNEPILESSSNGWDSQCIYKPSFLFQPNGGSDMLRVWYSGQDTQTRHWRIGLTQKEIS